jgi:hypothetical protein
MVRKSLYSCNRCSANINYPGGPAFLLPLSSAGALPPILSNLCPSSNPPRLVLAALRVLCNIAESAALTPNSYPFNAATLADIIFLHPHVDSFYRILLQSAPNNSVQIQVSLTASLISKLCRDERHQSNLANAGVLDALATRLASVVVSQGLVLPGAELIIHKEYLQDGIPPPAPPNADLAGILGAITVIIADSKFRASQLIYSNAILAVFPTSTGADFQPNRSTKAAWSAFTAADLSTRQARLNAVDYLIPHVPLSRTKSTSTLSSAFPPLGAPGSFEHLVQLGRPQNPSWPQSPSFEADTSLQEMFDSVNEPESALIAYLILLTRSTKDYVRLMAASVLTVLYRAGLTHKTRETDLGMLIVPILVQLLEEERSATRKIPDGTFDTPEAVAMEQLIKERTPAVIAMLIVDSEYLQKAAYDAGIIVKLSKLLKSAYDPVLDNSGSHTWSPVLDNNVEKESLYSSQSSWLGQAGQLPQLVHNIKMRESTLRAIAALVPFKDEYRKALIEQGIVPYIVESLKASPEKPSTRAGEKAEKLGQTVEDSKQKFSGFGSNPISVQIAACGAIRYLSRSVSILRTTLIDNEVVMPVFRLLRHPDIDVQIAATAAVCNLVMDFSPMRDVSRIHLCFPSKTLTDRSQTISAAGVLKILCEHAHSGNVKLRLNAIWALKSLVVSASNDVKKTCLDELGQGWLVQLICNDTEDEALASAKPSSGSIGLNGEVDEDVPMNQFEDDDETIMTGSIGALGRQSPDVFNIRQGSTASRPESSRGILSNSRLATLRDLETNPAQKARKDDIAVQEQGLDFIRNLIGGFNTVGTSETSEMIDFLFSSLGQDQIFEILASKLRSKVLQPVGKRNSGSYTDRKVIPPQPEIIIGVEYILVHFAASVPRHRQLVIAQTDLLKLLIPQFNHPNKEVRLALCWIVINLTWVDDTINTQACAQRAQELIKLGFLNKLENLEKDDELDVRERAKTAVWQMKQGYN